MVQTPARPPQAPLFDIPPLENGDRLSRAEFERRYAAMPEGCKAELIQGIVYISAAKRFRSHGKPHSQLNAWLATYQIFTSGIEIADAVTIRLDDDNEPQPDIALFIAAGGQTTISPDDYVEGPPELLAEISASTVSIDLGAKKTAYQQNGVQEYIVWRVLDGAIDWFYLDNGIYVDLLPDDDGIIRSRQFPGLWLDRSALLQDDMSTVIAVLQTGLASTAHQTFCQSLKN
jgi:Uma2 family endonuclease